MEQSTQHANAKLLLGVIIGISGIIILFGIFWLGMTVGAHRTRFECQWGERYGQVLGMPMMGERRLGQPPGFMDPNGADGEVISVNGQTLVVKGRDGVEKTVLVPTSTDIRSGRDTIKPQDIKVNDRVVIFGSPTSGGQIEAKFIRMFDQNLVK